MSSSTFVTVPKKNLPMSILLLLTIFICCSHSRLDHGLSQQTNITLYIHDYSSGPNVTRIAISGTSPDGGDWAPDKFGTMFCTDSSITEAREPESALVGQAQGILVNSAMDGSSNHVLVSLVFSGGEEYKGSSLQIQGSTSENERVQEVSVVSGTGMFRFVRGYATFQTVYYNSATNHSITEWNIVVEN